MPVTSPVDDTVAICGDCDCHVALDATVVVPPVVIVATSWTVPPVATTIGPETRMLDSGVVEVVGCVGLLPPQQTNRASAVPTRMPRTASAIDSTDA
jgi:hypothetical protein